MYKPILQLLCLTSLAGIFLLSACNNASVKTKVTVLDSSAVSSEESPVLPSPTLDYTTPKVIKPSSTPVKPTKTIRPTITPTATQTMTEADAVAAEIDLLLENLFADLENTEIIQETEIP